MDYDDIDYFRRRDVNSQVTTDATKLHNLKELRASGLKFVEVISGDVAVFKERGKPTVEFYTRRSRWKVRGQRLTHFGSVSEFVAWMAQFRDVMPQPRASTNHRAIAVAEQLRPGVGKLCERIQAANPSLDPTEVLDRAKLLWSSEYISVNRDGVRTIEPNPDYKGGRSTQGGFAGLVFLAMIVSVVLFFAGTLKLAHEEAREWEAFKVRHACKQVSTISGSITTYTYVGAGGMPATGIAYTPDKTAWMCGDGLLRVR